MIKAKKRKKKLISLKSLRKKAWDLQSEYIRKSEGGKCFTCGKVNNWKQMDCGHFIHRNSLDFVRENLHCQCKQCNYHKGGWRDKYESKMIERYGIAIVYLLEKKRNEIKKHTREELEGIMKYYKEKLKTL